MCELCGGSPHFDLPFGNSDSSAQAARNSLLLEATRPYSDAYFVDDSATRTDAATDGPKRQLKDKYGVDVREVDGAYEFYFRAGGQDNVVMRRPATEASLESAQAELDKIVRARVSAIEENYKVKFAEPGEYVSRQVLDGPDCKPVMGENIYARQATLPVLYGIEDGLSRSQPSQMIAGGKEGVKIYLLDRQPLPDFYGGRKVQGVFRFQDKDNKPAVLLTPATQSLGATSRDVEPGARNISWVTMHEIAHNSQSIQWNHTTPAEVAQEMGWEKYKTSSGYGGFPFIRGKNGELYANGSDSCQEPTTWFSIHQKGLPLDRSGKPVYRIKDAAQFTNEEVMERASIRPSTFYFMSPYEEMAEAITSYRSSAESRAQLFKNSPKLYQLVEDYERKELGNFYGINANRLPKMVRMPDGKIAERSTETTASLSAFETQIGKTRPATTVGASISSGVLGVP